MHFSRELQSLDPNMPSEESDYTILPDDVWSKILLKSLNLHVSAQRLAVYDLGYKENPGFGLSSIELTCSLFRRLVVQRTLWKEAGNMLCDNLKSLIRETSTEGLYRYEVKYNGSGKSAKDCTATRESLMYKRMYVLLMQQKYMGNRTSDISWTSTPLTVSGLEVLPTAEAFLVDGYMTKSDLLKRTVMGYKGCELYTFRPQKLDDPDEAVEFFLVKLDAPTCVLHSIGMELRPVSSPTWPVHVRLYSFGTEGLDCWKHPRPFADYTTDFQVTTHDQQQFYAEVVQMYLDSPVSVLLDEVMDSGNSSLDCAIPPKLCWDKKVLVKLYVKESERPYGAGPEACFHIVDLRIRGNTVPGVRLNQEGTLTMYETVAQKTFESIYCMHSDSKDQSRQLLQAALRPPPDTTSTWPKSEDEAQVVYPDDYSLLFPEAE